MEERGIKQSFLKEYIQEDDKDVEGVIYHHIGRGDT